MEWQSKKILEYRTQILHKVMHTTKSSALKKLEGKL